MKLHLAGMDAKDRWEQIRGELEKLESRLNAEAEAIGQAADEGWADEVKVQLHLAMMEAKDEWKEIEPHLRPVVEHLKKAGDAVGQALKDRINR